MNVKTTRRDAIKRITLAGAGTLLSQCSLNKKSSRPNIIFIMTDDQAVNEMSCYGNEVLDTPNMDRLAYEGAQFNNCFCTNSLCAPSLASVLTGCYSSLTGITANAEKAGETEQLNPELPTFPELLKDNGYYTALIGKYQIPLDPSGFDEWSILSGNGSYFNPEFIENGMHKKYKGYVTDIITYKAIDFLRRMYQVRPFCLLYHHKAPHYPFKPAPRHATMLNDFELPYPKTFNDDYSTRRIARLSKDMKFEIGLAGDYNDFPDYFTPLEKKKRIFQRFVKDHYLAVYCVDENIGRVLKYLDDLGLTKDTFIIFTSDNGFFLGEHGWYDKRFMYEPSLRIPLVIRYPGIVTPGIINNQMVLNVDLAPTILDFAGVPVPEHMHGKSLRPQLEGRRPMGWRHSIYYAYYENSRQLKGLEQKDLNDQGLQYFTSHRVGPHRGVRTRQYKLIEYYSEGDYWELFDLEEDPDELENLYGEPEYEDITLYLKDELRRLQKLYGHTDET